MIKSSSLFKDKNLNRLLVMMIFIFILMTILQPNLFPTQNNFISMAKQFPELGILAIAISVTMISGGIDLSVVAIANLSAILVAKFLIAYLPTEASIGYSYFILVIALILAIIIGMIAGGINGVLITKFKIPAILATLGTLQLFSGIAVVITEGKSISGLPIIFSKVGNSTFFGFLPMPLIIFIVITIIVGFLLDKTQYGKKLYLFGTNEKASYFSGVNNNWLIIRTYMISGMVSASAGLIMMARTNSINADYGSNYILQCILIAVLGGINPKGGFGNIKGVVVAVITLQFLSSGLNMYQNISNFYRDIIWGVVLIAVLILNYYIQKREDKRLLNKFN